MASLFQELELEAFRKGIQPRSRESMEWFRKKASSLGTPNRSRLMREEPIELKPKTIQGNMFMYFYDPKHKKTLPYYDTFPLSIIIGPAPGGFYGLNLHYLPLVLRAKMLDALLETLNNQKYDKTTKFNPKGFQNHPSFKHYLTKHVRSRFAYIPPPEWEIATFLPVADFQKATKTKVWKDSRRILNA